MKLLFLTSFLILTLQGSCLNVQNMLAQGECYEKEGNTNLAQAAYERAILEDDDNVQARIKLAQLYANLAMKEQANTLLHNVDETQLTPQQRNTLAALRTDPKKDLSSFKARVSLDVGYDTNINISPSSSVLTDLNSTIKDPTSTLFSRVQADLSYLHDLDTSGGWFLRSDANLFYQDNASAHLYDVAYGRVYAGTGYRSNKFSFYLPLFYDRMHYLNSDLLQDYGLRPDLTIELVPTLFTNVNATYTQRRYMQTADSIRNEDIISTGAGIFWLEGQDMAYCKVRYEGYTATQETPADFTNKQMFYLSIGGIYSLEEILGLKLDYQYRRADFAKTVNLKRDDSNHDIRFIIERDILPNLRVNAKYRYAVNISNDDIFEYAKQEMMLGITYNY